MSNLAIYKPKGRALEYSGWACNFYIGCTGGCHYCYLKKGRGAKILGGDKPTLKKCFRDESHALEVFEKELLSNIEELKKTGLFFSFTTDPMLPETNNITRLAMRKCLSAKVPVKILTKIADWVDEFIKAPDYYISGWSDWNIQDDTIFGKIAFGFTLTGHDELETGCSNNIERIEAMRILHEAGFKTFASIEPIIDFDSSLDMIRKSVEHCDLFKVGLESGKKYYSGDVKSFVYKVIDYVSEYNCKVYFKDSIFKACGWEMDVIAYANCIVNADYKLFNNK